MLTGDLRCRASARSAAYSVGQSAMRLFVKLAIIIVAVAVGSLLWLPDAVQQRGRGLETPPTNVVQQQSPAGAPSTIADESFAPVLPPGTKAARVEIMERPPLASPRPDPATLTA